MRDREREILEKGKEQKEKTKKKEITMLSRPCLTAREEKRKRLKATGEPCHAATHTHTLSHTLPIAFPLLSFSVSFFL